MHALSSSVIREIALNPYKTCLIDVAVVELKQRLLYCSSIYNFIKPAVMPFATATLKNTGTTGRFPFVGERWRWRV